MREVAKSMLGLSWAVSLFGMQQLSKAIAPGSRDSYDATATELDEVSRAVQSRLTAAAMEQFRAGFEWQQRFVDAVFDAATMQNLDPRRMVDALDPRTLLETADARAMVETGVQVMQKGLDTAVGTMRQTAGSAVEAVRRVAASVTPTA